MPFLWDTNPKPQTHHLTGVSTSAAIANEEPKKPTDGAIGSTGSGDPPHGH